MPVINDFFAVSQNVIGSIKVVDNYRAYEMLDNGELILGLFNYWDDQDLEVLAYFDDFGIPSGRGIGLKLTDIFTGETFTKFDFFTPRLPAMTCKVYKAEIIKR